MNQHLNRRTYVAGVRGYIPSPYAIKRIRVEYHTHASILSVRVCLSNFLGA